MEEEEPIDVSNPRQVRKKKSKHKLLEEEDKLLLQAAMSTQEGRLVLWRIICKCKVHQSCMTNDPIQMARFEGNRDIGTWLIDQIFTADPKSYILMRDEAVSYDTKREGKTNG